MNLSKFIIVKDVLSTAFAQETHVFVWNTKFEEVDVQRCGDYKSVHVGRCHASMVKNRRVSYFATSAMDDVGRFCELREH